MTTHEALGAELSTRKRRGSKRRAAPNRTGIHRYERHDRGLHHIHRWRAICSCGWIGKNHRREKFAKTEFVLTHHSRQQGLGLRPQRPTPKHLLPELLR